MLTKRKYRRVVLLAGCIASLLLSGRAATVSAKPTAKHQGTVASSAMTPVQLEIEKQRMRLSSTDVEDRRDALMRLGAMHNPAASRAAMAGLGDPAAIVKVAASGAILALTPDESAHSLIPLLNDKDEFVRRETAYALGQAGSRIAVAPLVERLLTDKLDSVRGAAAVALGQIRDETAVTSLAGVLNPQMNLLPSKRSKKKKKAEDPFVLRSAARSLGQIGSRAGLPALIGTLQDEQAEPDVRRESAMALGSVGDSSALPALRETLTAADPYLSQAVQQAIIKIKKSNGK